MGQAQLQSAEACLSIGHTAASDPHPASCEGPGGHNFGKAGSTFNGGEDVWILLDFTKLPQGDHTVQTREHGKAIDTRHFKNSSADWRFWFRSSETGAGLHTLNVVLDGTSLGSVHYCIDCPLE